MNSKTVFAHTAYDAWRRVLHNLVHTPEHLVAPRGHKTREILGVRVEINDWRNNLIMHPARNVNYKFAVAEWLWILLGLDDVSTLMRYNKQMSRFSDDGLKLAGAYGPRLEPQWSYILNTLRNDFDSRQAVATIFTPDPPRSKDVPCTISLQFLLRKPAMTIDNFEVDYELHLVVNMRSSDVWLGLPYDIYSFSMLANVVAGELFNGPYGFVVNPGSLIFNLGSSHLYDDNLQKALEVLDKPADGGTIRSPLIPGFPTPFYRESLVHSLRGEPYENEIFAPYSRYAQVLRADTWTKAREILEEGSRV